MKIAKGGPGKPPLHMLGRDTRDKDTPACQTGSLLPAPPQKYFRQVNGGRSNQTQIMRSPVPRAEGATRDVQRGGGGAHQGKLAHLRFAATCGPDRMRPSSMDDEEVTMCAVGKRSPGSARGYNSKCARP